VNVLIYLVPMALALGLTGPFAFLWSLRSGQYDDMNGAALHILSDDDLPDERGANPGGRSSAV
jgi:cbb3-type cytochrome oxidase maturation protein